MIDMPVILAAANRLTYALQESNPAGKVVLLVLFVASIFSWSVILSKMSLVRHARAWTRAFLAEFRADPETLRVYESGERFSRSPFFRVYHAACEELTFHLLGSTEVDETFRARLARAEKISPAQMRAVDSAMERSIGEIALALEDKMILLATAVSGAPFLGLLGTVWGVMDTFSSIAMAGNASLTAMAPGVSGALITTVTGLLVAIPAMFGYNFLVTSIRAMVVQLENFAAELSSRVQHRYVDHTPRQTP